MILAHVLIFRGVNTPYTYSVPDSLQETLRVGMHVTFWFGRSACTGLVIAIETGALSGTKPLLSVQPKKPVLSESIVALIMWFSEYYQCTPHKAYQTVIGSHLLRKLSESKPTPSLESPLPLKPFQAHIFETITREASGFSSFYVHGVTGSGKTEIYMQLAQHYIHLGVQCLILVPEIALTPQYTAHFQRRFGASQLAVIHSGLSAKERDVEWNRIYHGTVDIVIGPRSAIFSHLDRLGLIIIDEEHEPSYKQDSHPRYFTHTVAEYRAAYHQCPLVYGSATPRVQLYAQKDHPLPGKSPLKVLTMSERVSNNPLPSIEIVDMKESYARGEMHLFSDTLISGIQDRLSKQEKVIILLNRRGFSPYIVCQKCGKPHCCPLCHLSYTYHQDRTFRCHRCHSITPMTMTCSTCKKPSLSFSGTGIQKAELELRRFFSEATLMRLDKDTATTFSQLDTILQSFKDHGDILIGTQMIAKGHHIESVTLVGVLGIDTTLHLPDYTSPERTFQLLTQVAGRAGRGTIPGHVIIQTLCPDHYAIQHAKTHDYASFYAQEIGYRQSLGYPPFQAMVNLVFSATDLNTLVAYCDHYKTLFFAGLGDLADEMRIFGPEPAPIEKIRHHFRYHMMIKLPHAHLPALKQVLKGISAPPPSVRLILDIDPISVF